MNYLMNRNIFKAEEYLSSVVENIIWYTFEFVFDFWPMFPC